MYGIFLDYGLGVCCRDVGSWVEDRLLVGDLVDLIFGIDIGFNFL